MPLVIGIIAVLVVVVGGGILAYQYYYLPGKEQTEPPKVDFSVLNKDDLLHKLFPNLTFVNGVANHTTEHYEFLNLYLQNSIEDYFVNTHDKNLLLVAKLDGVAHVGGLYHAYLGLFDKNGNLLTPASPYPVPNYLNPYGDDYYDFSMDKTQFGGDQGDFGFYNCKGVKYIAFASAGCPNGTCCFGSVGLFRINNGEFEKVQTINEDSLAKGTFNLGSVIFPSAYAAMGPSYGLKMILSDEKIIVKKVPPTSDSGCPETNYKELKWNKNSCRFE